MRKPRVTSIISLSLAEGRLCAALLRLRGTKVQIEKTVSVPLSLDPVTADPELAGRELRNALQEAGFRAGHCVFCASQTWGLASQIELPEISEEDRASYLNLQAEREFPYSLEDMALASSLSKLSNRPLHANLFAIPKAPLLAIQRVLKEAKLNLLGVTIGSANIMDVGKADGPTRLGLVVAGSGLELILIAGGGIRSIRRFAMSGWEADEEGTARLDVLMRQLRITLAQMSDEMRDALDAIEVFGDPVLTDPLIAGLSGRFGATGIDVRVGVVALNDHIEFSGLLARSKAVGEIAAGVQYLLAPDMAMVLPLVSRRKRKGVFGKNISREMAVAGVVVLCLLLTPIGLFLHQKVRLSNLQSELKALQPKMAHAQSMKEELDRVGAWYTSVPQGLQILRAVAEAYPERGADAWTTSIEIRGLQRVTIGGKASSKDAVQAVHKKLMEMKSVDPGSLGIPRTTDSTNEKEPVVYTIEFSWKGEGISNGL